MDSATDVDGRFTLRDGRTLAWHEWGVPDGIPVLRLQGTPNSRFARHPTWERLGVRVIMADRPGYGASTRMLRELREKWLADPLADIRAAMRDAPPEDQAVMSDPAFQQTLSQDRAEALRPGAEGWCDECFAMDDWDIAAAGRAAAGRPAAIGRAAVVGGWPPGAVPPPGGTDA